MELNGVWRMTPADDDVRRDSVGVDTDDSDWAEVIVPGHWRDESAFATHNGPMMYRRHFTADEPDAGRRRWLVFDGIFYQGDVWLDGAYLGDPEGYFMPHAFDITALSHIGREHIIAVELTCSPQTSSKNRRNLTGLWQGWHGLPVDHNPGGIWRDVHLVDTGPVRIDNLTTICRDANRERAHLLLSARLDSDDSRVIRIVTAVGGKDVRATERRVARGMNDVAWTLDIPEPELWWPRALGGQPLTTIDVRIEIDGATSDTARRRTGLRSVAWDDWRCSVNGERIFLKSVNVLPPGPFPANTTDDDWRRQVTTAADAGLDAIRVYGNIAADALYDAADELGILVLQDFPMIGNYQRSVRDQAVAQATRAAQLLAHHPSIVWWAAHDESETIDPSVATTTERVLAIATQQLPTWNRTILDRWVKRAIERVDPTRLVIAKSGALPSLPLFDGADTHLYFGWAYGDQRDLDRLATTLPRVVRFVSEFGAQSVPNSDSFIARDRWPRLDDDQLAADHGYQADVFERRLAPTTFGSYRQWRDATQAYQAALVKHGVETMRRHKYRPTGGFGVFALNDVVPAISFGLIDNEGVHKAAWTALVDACRPVLPIVEDPGRTLAPGDDLTLRVWVVNDLRHAITGRLDAELSWAGGRQRWAFAGEIEADTSAEVAQVDLVVPAVLGEATLLLQLRDEGNGFEATTNRYSFTIAPA